jgi:hypothetical protein
MMLLLLLIRYEKSIRHYNNLILVIVINIVMMMKMMTWMMMTNNNNNKYSNNMMMELQLQNHLLICLVLDLRENNISPIGIEAIALAIQTNNSLLGLGLDGNIFTQDLLTTNYVENQNNHNNNNVPHPIAAIYK